MGIIRPPIAKNEREYVEICKELIESNDRRFELSQEIALKAKTKLYNQPTVIKEFEIFVRDAVFYKRKNKKLPTDWLADL